jgi:signal transduction histidine kinase
MRFCRKNENLANSDIIDVNHVYQEILTLVHHELKGHDIDIVVAADSGLEIRGDELRLQQVLLNILINAIQATIQSQVDASQEGQKIHLEAHARQGPAGGEEVVLTISDPGCGIPPEDLGKIFDPSYTTKKAGQGTGLGLAIAGKLIAEIGGRIEVASQLMAGTTFKVIMPRA